MAFIDPELAKFLTPPGWTPSLWIGVLATSTFGLVLIQFRTDWRARSEAHSRSFDMYAEVKREAGYLLASTERQIPSREFHRLASRYDMASDVGVGVPESEFLSQKRRHKVKIELSKILDSRPGAVIAFERFKILWRDLREKAK
ncbi:MAG: hypothetical protein HY834_10100 [Devosia nanyangense]|uniref:Uncharacterized protein n=1 Tax=Devosia nanyangense TaxID=1228055 RepID=A0A933L442_9HYPH|nr:hypothetical protein [Devosia nanyangense]